MPGAAAEGEVPRRSYTRTASSDPATTNCHGFRALQWMLFSSTAATYCGPPRDTLSAELLIYWLRPQSTTANQRTCELTRVGF